MRLPMHNHNRAFTTFAFTTFAFIIFAFAATFYLWSSLHTFASPELKQPALRAASSIMVGDRSTMFEVTAANRSLAFVHIGKAGGSSISQQLRNGCHEHLKTKPCAHAQRIVNETIASIHTEAYFHVTDVPFSRFSSYLITVRNPVRRNWDPHLCKTIQMC